MSEEKAQIKTSTVSSNTINNYHTVNPVRSRQISKINTSNIDFHSTEEASNGVKPDIQNPSRRSFIKKAVAGVAVTTSVAGIAKIVTGKAAQNAANKANLNDELTQDRIMRQKKYVLMTKEEKERMIKMFVDGCKEQA